MQLQQKPFPPTLQGIVSSKLCKLDQIQTCFLICSKYSVDDLFWHLGDSIMGGNWSWRQYRVFTATSQTSLARHNIPGSQFQKQFQYIALLIFGLWIKPLLLAPNFYQFSAIFFTRSLGALRPCDQRNGNPRNPIIYFLLWEFFVIFNFFLVLFNFFFLNFIF